MFCMCVCVCFWVPLFSFLPHLHSCGKCGGKAISERDLSSGATATNRGVIFMGPNHVEVNVLLNNCQTN